MIKSIAYCFLLLFTIPIGSSFSRALSYKPTTKGKNNLQEDENQVYYIDLPMDLDITEFSASIKLNPSKKQHFIHLPNGGTETSVFIYDKNYSEHLKQNSSSKLSPLAKGDFTMQQKVVLDITHLTEGLYYIHYLSCGNGGIFSLKIE